MEHVQEKGQCLLYTNFMPRVNIYEEMNGFRSILYSNFTKLKDGQLLNMASPRFMTAARHDADHISIQRGFRQYGQPLEATLKHLKVVEDRPTFEHRLCGCTCVSCLGREAHPVLNCAATCVANREQLRLAYIECWCLCSHCVMSEAHSRLECMHSCKTQLLA
jgi:hypothetical protein